MSAWKLLKHLEDGGAIKDKKSNSIVKLEDLIGWDYDPIRNPDDYQVIHCTVWTKEGSRHLTQEEWEEFDNNLLYRGNDLPTVEFMDGTKWWMPNGRFHRIGGPAMYRADRVAWSLDGESYWEDEYWEIINEVKSMSKSVRLTDSRRWVREYEQSTE